MQHHSESKSGSSAEIPGTLILCSSFPTEFLFRQHLHFYSLLFSCVLGKAKISSEIQTSLVSCLDLSSCVLLSFLVPTLPALMTTLHSNGANIILDVFNPGSSVHRWKVTSLSSSICFWQTDKGAFYHNFTAEVSESLLTFQHSIFQSILCSKIT